MTGSSFCKRALFVGIALGALTTPALAGSFKYADGQGQWTSTRCDAPPLPPSVVHDPETPADDMNKRLTAHNVFAAAVQDYMNCVSTEAQKDAAAISKLIAQEAATIQRTQQARVKSSANTVSRPASDTNQD